MTFVEGNTWGRALVALVALLATSLMTLMPANAAPRPNGYPVTNVNLRAGPGTNYPVIVVVPARSWISIRGCLADYGWCEVAFERTRGWMRSIYLQGWYRDHYYALRDYAPRLGYPVVTFDVGDYWDDHYRDRPFYAERARWDRSDGGGGAPYGEGSANRGSFYGRLQPYGNWIWLQGQYVWVPRNVGPYWRPYTVGRWVFTERYGWMWVSDEPFGWATYHYGRWGFSRRVGWFWVPGNRWAPAWVAWRSSNDYLAWAPLPPTSDEGLSINITVGNVPDYYWQVVPNRDFLATDLQRRIVRDRDRYDPILAGTRPIGNVTVVNNTVVNNVVNVTYIEQKTQKKVVVYKVEKTKDEDRAKGGKIKGEAVEIFQPAPEAKQAVAAPTQTKPIEEVAAESKTKEQGKGAAATEELLVPPEVKKPLEAEAKPPAPPPPAPPAGEGAATPAAEEAAPPPPPPPPAPAAETTPPVSPPSGDTTTPPAVEATPPANGAPPPPPPPAKEETPPPPPAEDGAPPPPPPPAEEKAPPPPPPPPAEEKAPPPPPPAEKAAPPPPPSEDAAPPPLPPPAEEKAPPPPPAEKAAPPPPQPEDATPPPPPPPAEEKAPPPPPAEETAPPPPTPADAPKEKKQRKPRKDEPDEGGPPSFAPPPPPAEEPAPPPPPPSPEEGMAPPSSPPMAGDEGSRKNRDGKPKRKKDRDGPCPEGMVALEDGNCVPSQ
jgi:uncharacterized protein YraI